MIDPLHTAAAAFRTAYQAWQIGCEESRSDPDRHHLFRPMVRAREALLAVALQPLTEPAPAAPRPGPDCDDPAKVEERIRGSMHALRATFGGAGEAEREVAARAARLLHELLGWLPTSAAEETP